MYLEGTGAKTDVDLAKLVVGIVTADTLGISLKALLSRDLLTIQELCASFRIIRAQGVVPDFSHIRETKTSYVRNYLYLARFRRNSPNHYACRNR